MTHNYKRYGTTTLFAVVSEQANNEDKPFLVDDAQQALSVACFLVDCQVRRRLSAGGSRIRTIGPACKRGPSTGL
jgi:hypothetical protein